MNTWRQKQDDLIQITPNSYMAVGMRLGRDELIAAGWSAFWTTAAKIGFLLIGSKVFPLNVQAILLAVIGPIAEKPGLFTHYIAAARKQYRETPVADREPLWHYIKVVCRKGWPTLRADLLFHDPSYAAILWLLLYSAPSAGPFATALFSVVSFVTGVFIASGLDVLAVHLMYRNLFRRLRQAGFVTKCYYEASFLVDPEGNEMFSPDKVLSQLQKHFGLSVRTSYTYRDIYLTKHSLAVYNGRRPYLRFRQRLAKDGSVSKQAVQIMYTHSREVKGGMANIYRCFARRKEKAGFDFSLNQPMPWLPKAIADLKVARIVQCLSNTEVYNEVKFTRHVIMEPDGILISVDIPPRSSVPNGAYWLEVKSRNSLDTLRQASDYIAWKLPVHATTNTKCDALCIPQPTGQRVSKTSP